MNNCIISTTAAAELILRGTPLSIAGPQAALDRLPAGNWIGGTTSYAMVDAGGTALGADSVFVTDLSPLGAVTLQWYATDALADITGQAPDNSFALTIIPAECSAHARFAAEAAHFPDAFLKPAVGWIAGVHLSEIGTVKPAVYDGRSATRHENGAMVAHITLPADKLAQIDIVNLFEPDGTDCLRFQETSFHVTTCEVNGETVNFAEYVRTRALDHGRLPLVGDFAGAFVNASLQSIDDTTGCVNLYAPVFPGVDYHFAKPVDDYASAFRARIQSVDPAGVELGCNCILNFAFGELENKAIGGVGGPVGFGEIGYQLLNQTMVMLRIV